MSTCVSTFGEFSEHIMIKTENSHDICTRCGYCDYSTSEPSVYYDGVEVDAPANIKQGDWANLCTQVAEIHAFITTLHEQLQPTLASIQSRGIMGLLMGSKGK